MDMEQTPWVSVVVPVYNMEQYLGETLDAILASDYPTFEVIVMDDGSDDRSLAVAQAYAAKDPRVHAYSQPNAGACRARNRAIGLARGELILPVDGDDLITPSFIREAVREMEKDEAVKVVVPRADFIGERSGEWQLPPFSLHLLARKNMMAICALYRKADWERAGGYCEEIIAREDWEFWISLLKTGGKVVKLPDICLYYRVRHGSKRITDRSLKRHVIDVLNKRHPEFFERELGGPLHYRRSWSRWINRIYRLFHPRKICLSSHFASLSDFMKLLPLHFERGEGEVIYKGRNELRQFQYEGKPFIVKSFRIPNLVNRIAYGIFRPSKAARSYAYAQLLLCAGIGTPEPVGYYTERNGLLFARSYYISLKSECPYTYYDLVKQPFAREEQILRAIARTTAALHEHGYLHKDYSRGNILFGEFADGIRVEIIDLNRIRFKRVSPEEGCRNFERLPGTEKMFRVLADEYAKARGLDGARCFQWMMKYKQESHE